MRLFRASQTLIYAVENNLYLKKFFSSDEPMVDMHPL